MSENSLFDSVVNKETKEEKIAKLVKELTNAKNLYYSTGDSPLTDSEFDKLEEELFTLDSKNSYFDKVGETSINVISANTIKHAVPMLSSDKAKTSADVKKWITKLNLPSDTTYIVEPKIDGLSASISYVKGKLDYIATRGDGKIGQNITHISNYINIPKELSKPLSIEIRGELYLPKNTTFNTGGRPLRNNCVGLINRKEKLEDLQYVNFCAYQIASQTNQLGSESEVIDLIKSLGFASIDYFVAPSDELESYFESYLATLRDEWLYETDGLIIMVNDKNLHSEIDSRWVVSHHHHYAIALKPPAEMGFTTLESIEWNVSRSGSVVPIAIFKPIILGSATISRATLHNADFVSSLHLFIGDQLEVERANDVIPYVRCNLTNHDDSEESNLIIKTCPSCATILSKQGVHLKCSNVDCPAIKTEQILYWVQSCGMENIGESAIKNLFKEGLITSITDLYKLTFKDLIKIEGFADKKIENFLSEVEKSKKQTVRSFIAKLGINLVGEKAMKKLGINTIDDFLNFCDITYIIGKNLIEWRDNPTNKLLVDNLLTVLTISDETSALLGEVCMTGKADKPRNELEAILKTMGYASSSNVSKNTLFLICDDVNGTSSKLEKARKLGIEIKLYSDVF